LFSNGRSQAVRLPKISTITLAELEYANENSQYRVKDLKIENWANV
jgi:virulence-associated protein VagC